ncbi:MAG TPA: hypothetical protein VGI81_22125 [Tepidisphaeraceae bacterium]
MRLLILALAAACAAAAHSTTQPTPRAAHPERGLRIDYSWGGGIRGDFHHRLIATPDVASGKADGDMTRIAGDRAVAVADLLRRAGVMNWPAGIHGRGQWNDDYHYFLDLTMDGKTHSIHVATDGPTRDEALRLQTLMKDIEAVIAAVRPNPSIDGRQKPNG